MQIQIKATQAELAKSDRFGLAIGKVLDQINPEARDYLTKAIAPKDSEIAEPVVLEVLKQWGLSYKDQTDKMIDDIEGVFDVAAKKSIDDTDMEKGGPYIGPRGGKWADPQHTIPWKDEHAFKDDGKRYSDEEALERLTEIGDGLYQHQMESAMGGYTPKDDTGLNHIDMQNWPKASGLLVKRNVLRKYKRQIGIKEWTKLGLGDKTAIKAEVVPYYNKTWGSLMLPLEGGRIDRSDFNKYLAINRKHDVWFSRESRESFVKESNLDDFDFEAYRNELLEIGIDVKEPKGQRRAKPEDVEANWDSLTIAEAVEAITKRKLKKKVALKHLGGDKFGFYYSYADSLNELFQNKNPKKGDELIHGIRLSGILEANADQNYRRETTSVELMEEALEKISRVEPDFDIAIDPKFKEAQAKRDRYNAELELPIPEVQKMLAEGFKLRPYQNEAVRFFQKTDGKALLGDEMGTGKTPMTLAYLATGGKKAIVVNPKATRRNWINEAAKFFPDYFKGMELIPSELNADYKKADKGKGPVDDSFKAVMGLEAVDQKWIDRLKDKNIVSVNYESLHKFASLLKRAGFDTIVVDESHRMKNPKAKITSTIQEVAQDLPHKILLSGTAIKNKKEELHTQLNLIEPGKWGSARDIKYATIGGLWEKMKPIYLARSKSKVLKDLPPKSTTIMGHDVPGIPDYIDYADKDQKVRISAKMLGVPLPDKYDAQGWDDLDRHIANQREDDPKFDTKVKKYIKENGIKVKVDIGKISKLKNDIAIAKAPTTANFAKEILGSSDSKMIVFTESVEAAKVIHKELGDVSMLHHGQLKDNDREAIKEEFQKQNSYGEFTSPKRVIVTTRQSMAEGVTLTAADKVLINDLPWTAAAVRQAEDRTHRIGQNKAVDVYWITADNNQFDSSVANLVKRKYDLSMKVNQGRKLTDEEIEWMDKKITLDEVLGNIGGAQSVEEDKVPSVETSKEDVPIGREPVKREPVKTESVTAISDKIDEYNKEYSELFTGRPKRLKIETVDTPKTKDLYLKFVESQRNDSGTVDSDKLAWVMSRNKDLKDAIEKFKSPKEKKEKEKKKVQLTSNQEASLYDLWKDSYYEQAVQLAGNRRDDDGIIDYKRNENIASDYALKNKITVFYQGKGGIYKIVPNSQGYYDIEYGNFHAISNPYIAAEKVQREGGVWLPKKSLESDTPKDWSEWRELNADKVKEKPVREPVKDVDKPKIVREPVKVERKPVKEEPKRKRGRPPKPESVKRAESDLSLVSAQKVKLKKLKSDATHDFYQPSIELDEDDARIAMGNLRDEGINVIITHGPKGVVKIRKGFDVNELEDSLSKAFDIEEWIGVDLDGTLAEYKEYKGPEHIGKPIMPMVDRVKRWLASGKKVKVMTARANPENGKQVEASKAVDAIKLWCIEHIGKRLDVTYKKDYAMVELWDDRAVGVKPNKGVKKSMDQITDEMKSFFEKRTKRHIDLVKKYCDKFSKVKGFEPLKGRGENHDQSKYGEFEMDPYIWLTWKYKCKDESVSFECPIGMEEKIREATLHHILNNRHHPEYHQDKKTDLLNERDRDKPPTTIIDATKMPMLDIAEMVADWLAMSEEKNTNVFDWIESNVNKRWKFTDDQVNTIRNLAYKGTE